MNMAPWFNDLPINIRLAFGNDKFDKLVLDHLKAKCYHPIKKSPKECKFCHDSIDVNLNQDDLIKRIKFNYKNKSLSHYSVSEDLSNLSNLLALWLIDMYLNKDIIIDGENWSDEESFETNSDDSNSFIIQNVPPS